MSSRIADVAVPPMCSEMIGAGALVAVNHSGGTLTVSVGVTAEARVSLTV